MAQATLRGTSGADVFFTNQLNGADFPDDELGPLSPDGTVVLALGGDDTVVSGGGAVSTFEGGEGDDLLFGSEGDDTLRGGDGNDFLDGGSAGGDLLDGGADDDELFLLHSTSRALGGLGADLFSLAGLLASESAPPLAAVSVVLDFRPAEGDRLGFGGIGAVFVGAALHALVLAEPLAARAALSATGEALPQAIGGAPGGLYVSVHWVPDVAASGGWILVDADATRTLSAADYAVRVDTPGGGAFSPSWFAAGELPQLGTPANDLLVLGGAGGALLGLGGEDTLYATGSGGTLIGGTGDDLLVALPTDELGLRTLLGEAGNDTYVVWGHAAIHEAAGEGFDTAWLLPDDPSRPSFLDGEVELVRLLATGHAVGSHLAQSMSAHAPDTTLDGGGANDALWGDDNRNVLRGGEGDDVLRAGGGNDTLEGGLGADQLIGGAGRDLFVFREADWSPSTAQRDQISDFVRGEDLLLIAGGGADPLANLLIMEIGGHTQIVSRTTGAAVDLYGVTGLTAADFAPIL